MRERFQKIAERWFIMEPAFFQVYCSHELEENRTMNCPLRCGRGKLQYNPQLLEKTSDAELEELLKIEAIRILLKHPYDRQPDLCSAVAKSEGSNCVIADNYVLKNVELTQPAAWNLPSREHFEFYARAINDRLPKQSEDSEGEDENQEDSQDSGEESKDSSSGQGNLPQISQAAQLSLEDESELWQEDSLMQADINQIINEVANSGNGWGSLPGNLVEQVVASTKVHIDYRKVLSGFRASILTSKRKLTRMKPNRRTGFANMGSQHDFATRLLIAVDVSGSISSGMLRNFYGIINRFFKYGIEEIDTLQFDCELGPVTTLNKATTEVQVAGRGGTDFQPVIDFAASASPSYDGLIILTDGYAPTPKIPANFPTRIAWVFPNEKCMKNSEFTLGALGRICYIELD